MRQENQNDGSSAKKTDQRLLAGAVPLTPEAQAILTRQVNRKILWGYKFVKSVFYCLSSLPILLSALFAYGFVAAGIDSPGAALLAFVFVAVPALATALLFRLVSKL